MRKPVIVPGVQAPTGDEREKLEFPQMPLAPWCEICVRSKSRGTPRSCLLAPMDDRETPLTCMTFAAMDTDGEVSGEKATAFATTLILVENKLGYPIAFSVETQGEPSHGYLSAAVGKRLDHFGVGKFIEMRQRHKHSVPGDGHR